MCYLEKVSLQDRTIRFFLLCAYGKEWCYLTCVTLHTGNRKLIHCTGTAKVDGLGGLATPLLSGKKIKINNEIK